MNLITSNQNPIVKELKSLKEKKYREEKQQFFIEGIRFVEEALKEDVDIAYTVIAEKLSQTKGSENILEKLKNKNSIIHNVTDKIFKEISDTENPQGILAVINMKNCSLDSIISKDNFLVILEAIQDPGNMGTIIRTADAAGAAGIIASKGCVDIYNPKVLRSTMGSIFHTPVCYTDDLTATITVLKSKGFKVLAAHLKGESDYFTEDMKGCCGIIVGNEANGISDEVAGQADVLVKIPMPGKAESLNASVAASLLMYEAVRQRR